MRAKEFVTELNMAPGNLQKFVQSPAAAQFQAGFEAEVLLPGEYTGESSGEPDYSMDTTLPRNLDKSDIESFFELGSRSRVLEKFEVNYYDYVEEQAASHIEDDLDERITYLQDDDEDLDYDHAKEKAWDELRDEYLQGSDIPSMYDFCKDNYWSTYSDLANEFNIDWPYFETGGDFSDAVEDYQSHLEDVVEMTVDVSPAYHGDIKQLDRWYLEPDESISTQEDGYVGVEIVSPPMPVMQMLDKLTKTLNWVEAEGGFTNNTTGFHVGISLGEHTKNVDYVKLALFLGDDYILQRFGRAGNTYAVGSMQLIRKAVAYRLDANDIATQLYKMKTGLVQDASRQIFTGNSGKFTSINLKDNYIEFRSMGNDYLTHLDTIKDTILRYIRAYAVAVDPTAERKEYLKKLSALLNPSKSDQLGLFVQYVAGDIGKNDLVSFLKSRSRKPAPQVNQSSENDFYPNEPPNAFHPNEPMNMPVGGATPSQPPEVW